MGISQPLKTLPRAVAPLGLAAVFAASCVASQHVMALDPLNPVFSFNGFGTLGAVYSDEDQTDFVSSWLLQPNGAGHTSDWHAGVDTKLGGQVNAQLNEKLSAVLQVVVERQEDNAWSPAIEWANIGYQFNDNLSFRLGRTVISAFMVSDTRLVGYANPWIRGPQELYQIVPITNVDGIDVVYELDFDNWRNTTQLSYGQTDQDIIRKGELRARDALIVSNSIEYNDLTFRLAYISAEVDLESSDSDTLYAAYDSLGDALALIPGLEDAAAQASAIRGRYEIKSAPTEVYSIGLRLEPNDWLFMTEWARITQTNAFQKADAWYATVGYRFATLTPYLTLAEVNGDTPPESGVTTAGMPPPLATATDILNEGIDQLLFQASHAQKSITAGIRWDFSSQAALKLQYQHIEVDAKSAGRLSNVQPAFTPGGRVNTFSATIDFVF